MPFKIVDVEYIGTITITSNEEWYKNYKTSYPNGKLPKKSIRWFKKKPIKGKLRFTKKTPPPRKEAGSVLMESNRYLINCFALL